MRPEFIVLLFVTLPYSSAIGFRLRYGRWPEWVKVLMDKNRW